MGSRRRDRAHLHRLSQGEGPRPGPGALGTVPLATLKKRLNLEPSQLQFWEIQAFFFGVLATLTPEYGPELILKQLSDGGDWWKDIGNVMNFSRTMAMFWGSNLRALGRCGLPLHEFAVSDPPTVDELRRWVWEREREIQRFFEGVMLSGGRGEFALADRIILADFGRLKVSHDGIVSSLRRHPVQSAEATTAILAELRRLSIVLADLFFRMDKLALDGRTERDLRAELVPPPYLPCRCASGKLTGACCGT